MTVELLLYLLTLVGPEVQTGKLQDCKPQDGNNYSSPVNTESEVQREKVTCPRVEVEPGLDLELFKPGSLQR